MPRIRRRFLVEPTEVTSLHVRAPRPPRRTVAGRTNPGSARGILSKSASFDHEMPPFFPRDILLFFQISKSGKGAAFWDCRFRFPCAKWSEGDFGSGIWDFRIWSAPGE